MNIEQANAIALPKILQKLGSVPVKNKEPDIWYFSPFRSERTASFHVNTQKNIWYDFGETIGGKPIDFMCAYLKSQGESDTAIDALRWFRNMMGTSFVQAPLPIRKPSENVTTLVLQHVSPLNHRGLLNYLETRKIPFSLANKYLKEVFVLNANTGKKFHALALPNESDGYELRNMIFKGCIGMKGITFIRGKMKPAIEIHVFEGMMDFLSALESTKQRQFAGDIIILNSISCLPQVYPYIKNYLYRSLYTWLDNDKAGLRATDALKELAEKEGILTFQMMNRTYAPHKDVNNWFVSVKEKHVSEK